MWTWLETRAGTDALVTAASYSTATSSAGYYSSESGSWSNRYFAAAGSYSYSDGNDTANGSFAYEDGTAGFASAESTYATVFYATPQSGSARRQVVSLVGYDSFFYTLAVTNGTTLEFADTFFNWSSETYGTIAGDRQNGARAYTGNQRTTTHAATVQNGSFTWVTFTYNSTLGDTLTETTTKSSTAFPGLELGGKTDGATTRATSTTTTVARSHVVANTSLTSTTGLMQSATTVTETTSVSLSSYTLHYTHVLPGSRFYAFVPPLYATLYRANRGEVCPLLNSLANTGAPLTLATFEPQTVGSFSWVGTPLGHTLTQKTTSTAATTATIETTSASGTVEGVTLQTSATVADFGYHELRTTRQYVTSTAAQTWTVTTTRTTEVYGGSQMTTHGFTWTTTHGRSFLSNTGGAATTITYSGSRTITSTFSMATTAGGDNNEGVSNTFNQFLAIEGSRYNAGASFISENFIPFVRVGSNVTGAGQMTLGEDGSVAKLSLGGNRQWQILVNSSTSWSSGASSIYQSASGANVSLTVRRTTTALPSTTSYSLSFSLATGSTQITYQSNVAGNFSLPSFGVSLSTFGGHGAHAETTLLTHGEYRRTVYDSTGGSTVTFGTGAGVLASHAAAIAPAVLAGIAKPTFIPSGPMDPITYATT
jgi:hypothetical protein